MGNINYQFGEIDAHGAAIRAQAAALETTHQAILATVRDAAEFWGGQGSTAHEMFIADLGRNFQMIYEQANSHGQKVQRASSSMADTDRSVSSAWS
ncbi:hypothetical protein JK2ML_1180 [Mycobacterium leprae Kyoto-2]|uniref:Putative ESAT-6-like protein X n=2 Tax=Mycobacterium leprae TaxID=1769 RepID=ES6LX_MYCLE|nr:WXG100 family type VII secretion target [Mycobacterium leprae]Q49946.1 RecName: Full=Putative ESAT-6-like protein X [Mycobacterium leprae TN]CAR71151.1 conserved hypothetical protein [Mycobacterium leprae Br4923]AAA62902.1 u1756d [Mycobacterium leprae]OAR19523.1 type VII secretion protein EsxI [Mycobacterium leprae 3125609]OAR19681.1 type VII secretion protein EsxI [Mycobacterium leprae 3125609]OAR20281.1 type VII secretion protein EsxI [Mycobacterium leprae 3125609]